ncbi:hypothetical protein LR48_Vigan11g060400 [Vigna angularis]|uniref:Uncharacterized protein n=1 Tax=Phaseolus angularis TaxID=3914 RepID=A0A0L9VR75_PHAAN|nr:hypothetical protein LR48_Vigan11g060400 [Vigna angularis]
MASTVNLSSSTKIMGGEGRGNVGDAPSTVLVEPPIETTPPNNVEAMLSGEEAFVYENVIVEGPKEEEDLASPLPVSTSTTGLLAMLSDMSLEELESLDVLDSLPPHLSSRKVINFLGWDDFNIKVFEELKYRLVGMQKSQPVNQNAEKSTKVQKKIAPSCAERHFSGVEITAEGQKQQLRGKTEVSHLPLSGHKIDFNLADSALELSYQAALANWNLAYAYDRGKLRSQLKES